MANDTAKILPIPDIPTELLKAAERDELVIFIGAGVSRIMGCASWDSLSYNLIRKCLDLGLINFAQKEHLLKSNDNKQKITIAFEILYKNDLEEEFWDCMECALQGKEEIIAQRDIYYYLNKFGAIYVTTNADELFDKHIVPKQNIIDKDKIMPIDINSNYIYHIHGMMKSRNVVFRASEYLTNYQDPKIRDFLIELFNEKYTLLFLGYGLSEFELLDYIIGKSEGSNKRNKEFNKFLLKPYNESEMNLVEVDEHYYEDLGVKIIPYNYEEKGYDQLFYIMEEWSKEFSTLSNFPIYSVDNIRKTIQDFKHEDAKEIIGHIKEKEYLSNLFFKEIHQSIKPQEWFGLLKEYGFFNPEEFDLIPQEREKGYFYTPIWHSFEYLKLITSKKLNDEEYYAIKDILKVTIEYLNSEKIENYRIYETYIDIISNLPINKIYKYQIKNIAKFISSGWGARPISFEVEALVKKLLQSSQSEYAFIIIDKILAFNKKENNWLNYKSFDIISVLPEYELKNLLKTIRLNLKTKDFSILINLLYKLITKMENIRGNTLNYVWMPTIEDDEQTNNEKYEIQLVKLLRDILEKSEAKKIKSIIEEMYSHKGSVLRRIAIYIINKKYSEFKDIFWGYKGNPLDEVLDTHEVYELFKNNVRKFSEDQITKILSWIEDRSYDYIYEKDIDEEIKGKQIAYRKKEWLSSLIDSNDKRIKKEYDIQNNINDTPLSHPGYLSWHGETKWENMSDKSPFSVEEILQMDNSQLIEEIKSYDPPQTFDGPTKENFAWEIRASVEKEPTKFDSSLDLFEKIDCIYIDAILSGFESAAGNKKKLKWKQIFDYIFNVISIKEFSECEEKNRIIRSISDLIKHGSNSESYGFGKERLDISEDILFILYDYTNKIEHESTEELYINVLQDPQYQIFEALIYISLKDYRIYKKKGRYRINSLINKNLKDPNYPTMFFAMGQYIILLNYMDKEWVKKNFNVIYNKGNLINWYASMSGFLLRNQTDKDIYIYMKENGDIEKALETEFDNQFINKPIQHLAIAYMNEIEKFSEGNSTINYLIENGTPEQIMELLDTVWRIEWKDIDVSQKVEELFNVLYENFVEKSEYNEVFTKYILLFKFIKHIEAFKLKLKYCIQCIEKGKYVTLKELLDFLDDRKDNNSDIVIVLLKELAKRKATYNKNDERIQEILDYMYQSGKNKSLLDSVCREFIQNDRPSYKDLFDKYN